MITDEYGLEHRQKELLRMIKEVNSFLEESHIQYSVCGGTLLGAIRHNGFIPWDDDIDIMIDRPNYEKLVKLFKRNKGVIRVEGLNEDGKKEVTEYTLFRKLWIYRIRKKEASEEEENILEIDVFVMDRCPDNVALRSLKVFVIRILQGMMHEKFSWKKGQFFMNLCLAFTYLFGKLFTGQFKFKMYQRVSQWGNNKKTRFVTGYNDYFNLLTLRYAGNLMDKMVNHEFETIMLPITAEYDNYLSTQYGDYMTPPKKEDRIPLHVSAE